MNGKQKTMTVVSLMECDTRVRVLARMHERFARSGRFRVSRRTNEEIAIRRCVPKTRARVMVIVVRTGGVAQ